ncbi:hypothetical protein HanRHA438_Chr01g0009521 [Helianthus annuus]|uniref:Uncharacterized protein n=1 Tax=Helianthus annuus TaxID=4232 RepID=A0A9K3P1C8_HELAN|nr:hypothetical protein HanXRQr2_Chr01g0009211 [Helianthus annuus]KAJ0610771.1 hypothetical protein HanHA300_Chr01g0007561 [Helianthus annuus]KAJ0621569.1 hypothetical protein HanIR_Chr01g0010171 [Helianthus annuus]KAJ0626025.1 hypothetical protein HanHA89_Chr01g0008261 [Helianthus annuus]KAJ0782369.1 hypothetical protein HanLR1_Chr01g0007311 [Helianthus annuus]
MGIFATSFSPPVETLEFCSGSSNRGHSFLILERCLEAGERTIIGAGQCKRFQTYKELRQTMDRNKANI